MRRALSKLTALEVTKAKTPGMYGDGGGLYLQVSRAGTKSWIFRFSLLGRAREMGLGPQHTVSLAEARIKAANCRKLCLDGIDPIDAKRERVASQKLEAANIVTFETCGTAFIRAQEPGWRNEKHAAQWTSTLRKYVYPKLGKLPVSSIDTGLVLKTLEPIWATKTETASRVRGRMEAILDWAKIHGYRNGENPARWRGHLDKLLPKKSKVHRIEHFPALPYSKLPAFYEQLRANPNVSARAFEFLILTATRSGEVFGAVWPEFNLSKRIWTIPAERMKADREHRVPLSKPAMAILASMSDLRMSEYVFPGGKKDKPLSNGALLALLKRMELTELTPHGFRSTFRDWAAEETTYSREVVEMALAHTIENKVEAAYRRGDLFEKRRQLASDWAEYCESFEETKPTANSGTAA